MSRMTGAQALVELLQRHGVDTLFALPGVQLDALFSALYDAGDGIRVIHTRHEQAAAYMAYGYAKSTGKVGVVLVTSGPGATNAVTGLTDALMDSVPIVCLTGQVPTHLIGNDAFQEADTTGITRPVTKHNYLVTKAGEVQHVLLVCPKPLVTNWTRELQQWAPDIPLVTIDGDQAKRHWQWRLAEVPLRIANYELLHRDAAVIAAAGITYDLVILDEAQRIKNRSGATSQVVCALPRRRGWALTGTPIENSTQDLVGIFEFLSPGVLRPDMKPRRMGKLTADYVLRRTKDQVLTDLPPKTVRDSELDLSPEQRHSYTLAEEEGVLRLTSLGDSVAIEHVFELVLRLKQICNFDPATGESTKFERLEADLEEVVASGRKAIVFSQWVDTLRTLGRKLARFAPLEYHGQVPSREREEVVRRFRETSRHPVLLISYGAGGVGLNLQCAQYVFLFDRWWNPALEDQAINRAHRIGVDGPVTVSRFLTVGTIEQRIDQILREKREIFDTVFGDLDPHRRVGLTQQELLGLFRLQIGNPTSGAAA